MRLERLEMKSKSIVIKYATYRRLALLKVELGARSFDEVITYLLSQVKEVSD